MIDDNDILDNRGAIALHVKQEPIENNCFDNIQFIEKSEPVTNGDIPSETAIQNDSAPSERRARSSLFPTEELSSRNLSNKDEYISKNSEGISFICTQYKFRGESTTIIDSYPHREGGRFGLCHVCEEFAQGINYGVPTCKACKEFFFCSSVKTMRWTKYKCALDGKCTINRENRNKCNYCRFKKCCAVGMTYVKARAKARRQSLTKKHSPSSKHCRSSESPDAKLPALCEVCKEDVSTGIHYGIQACDSCKTFFSSSVIENSKWLTYQCSNNEKCNVRNECKCCRLKACMSSGVKSDISKNEKESAKDPFVITPDATSPVWLDLSSNFDDILAIAILAFTKGFRIIGVSTVFGTHHVTWSTVNTLKILDLLRINSVEVVKGSAEPLCRKLTKRYNSDDEQTHLSPCFSPSICLEKNCYVCMCETMKSQTKQVTIITTGPLTNLALLLKAFPEVRICIQKIIMVGGTLKANSTDASLDSEYSVKSDPEAAHIVFNSQLPLTMIPLETSNQLVLTEEKLQQIRAIQSFLSENVASFLTYYLNSTSKNTLGAVFAIQPNLFESKLMCVDIERMSEFFQGATLCRTVDSQTRSNNVTVVTGVKSEDAWSFIIDTLVHASMSLR